MRKTLLLLVAAVISTAAIAQTPTITGNAQVQVFQGNDVWRASLNALLAGRVGPDSTFVKLSGSYLNRRISDNVYKYGTLGLRTTDTTGILTLASNSQKKCIAILNPDTSNTWIFSMSNPYSNRPTWNHTAYWGGNGSGGIDPYPNLVFRLGSNMGPSNNQILSAPSFFDQWETNWWGTGVLGEAALRNIYERHWIVIDSGNVQHRPLTGYFEKKAGGRGELAAYVTRFRIGDWNFDQNARLSVNKNSEIELATANFYNDSLYTVDTAAIGNIAAAFFASSNKDGGGSVLGRGTGIVIGGKGSFTGYSAILGEYTTTNANGNMDLIFTTQDNNSTGVQRKRMWIKSGTNTRIGINNPSPAQALDIGGSLLVRGSHRINARADSAGLIVKYASGQTAPAVNLQFNNGTSAGSIHIYDYNSGQSATNASIVTGRITSIHSLSPANTVYGITSAQFTSGAGNNALFGYTAGNSINGGYENAFFGSKAGAANSTGFQNTFIGYLAGTSNVDGYQNMFLGRRAGTTNSSGTTNVGIGTDALRLNSTGSNNVAIGSQSGDAVTGSSNVIIGAAAGRLVTGSGNVLIGRQAGELETSISNYLILDNSNTSTPLIAGDFSANTVGINLAPSSISRTLDVNGEVRIRDLTTVTPTQIVSSDANGVLAAMKVGSGLTISNDTLKATGGGGGVTDHGALTGLADDDHTQYALLAGRATGQTLTGGTASSDNLKLRSTSNATKGDVVIQDQGGNIIVGGAETTTEIRFMEGASGGTNYTALKAPSAQAANVTYTLPTAAPTSDGQVLSGNTGGTLSWTDNTVAPSIASPANITVDQDNYNPTNWSTAGTIFVTGSHFAITGFAALPTGTERTVINSGTAPLYIPGEHPDSDAANRVATACDQILAPNGGSIRMVYNGTTSRWYIVSNSFNAAIPGANGVNGHYYNVSVGATTGADWGTVGFGLASGGNGTTAPTSTLPAGWDINTSTSATGASSLYLSKTVVNPVELGSAHIITSCVVYVPTLSDGTNSYTFQFGLIPSPTSTTLNVNNSVGIRYTHGTNSGKWQGFSRDNAGSESTADLGTTVATNTAYILTVAFDKARSEARFYLNGTFAGRVTGNMPNATTDAGSRAIIVKSAGTTSRSASVSTFTFYTVY